MKVEDLNLHLTHPSRTQTDIFSLSSGHNLIRHVEIFHGFYFCDADNHPSQIRLESISWIRRSTDRLCLEVAPDLSDYALQWRLVDRSTQPRIPLSSLGPNPEMTVISSLTLNQFHDICYSYLSTLAPHIVHDKIQLSAIVSLDGDSIQGVAHIPNAAFNDNGWRAPGTSDDQNTPIYMDNGWSWYDHFLSFKPCT